MPAFVFYSRREYYGELIERASRLGKQSSITLMTMNFDPQVPLIDQLMTALSEAAARGAEVRLIVDAMDFIQDKDGKLGPLFYGKPLDNRVTGSALVKFQKLEKLRECGGRYWVINQPAHRFSLPIAGRSHIKLALIDDRVYLGGCNLDGEHCADIMVGWNDTATAQWLYQIASDVVATGNVKKALHSRDLTRKVNDTLSIFVDSGVRKQSIIYEQALGLIDEANATIYITCQFFPGGPTAQHLLTAHNRGVALKIAYNNPSKHRQPLRQQIYNLRERLRLPASFFEGELPVDQPKLHAKIITTEQAALVGSHNYVDIGVRLGTAEIAFMVRDASFAERLGGYRLT